MTCFDQTEDETVCLGSRHAEVMLRCGAVNVIDEALPTLALTLAGGIVGESGCMDKGGVIAGMRGSAQGGFS